mmetsp:Transcript_35867/g.117171  ORF Transcript_35867/g.117171 Transcript_35867/m.117171 type:complete len:224 (-) Transcript_35867:836-1507(-)
MNGSRYRPTCTPSQSAIGAGTPSPAEPMTTAVRKERGACSMLGGLPLSRSSVLRSGSSRTMRSRSTCSISSSAYSASISSRCACTAVAHNSRVTACLRKCSGSPERENCSIPPTNCCSTSSSAAIRHRWIASAFARVTERSAPEAIEPTAVPTSSSRKRCRCALSAFMFGSITSLLASSTHDTAAAAAFSARAASSGRFDSRPASAARAEQMASCSSARAQRG